MGTPLEQDGLQLRDLGGLDQGGTGDVGWVGMSMATVTWSRTEMSTDPIAKAAGTVVLVAVAARLGWELLRPMVAPLVLAGVVWLLYVGWRRGRRW